MDQVSAPGLSGGLSQKTCERTHKAFAAGMRKASSGLRGVADRPEGLLGTNTSLALYEARLHEALRLVAFVTGLVAAPSSG